MEAIGDMTTRSPARLHRRDARLLLLRARGSVLAADDLPRIGAARCCLQRCDLFRGRAPLAAVAAAVRDGLFPRRHLSGGNEDRVGLVRSRPRTGAGLSRWRAGARHRDPHLLGHDLPWESVMLFVSAIAALGGLVMYWLVPDGPYLRAGAGFDPIALGRHLPLTGFSRLGIRLFRPYVGALCLLGLRAGLSCGTRRARRLPHPASPCGASSSLARERSAAFLAGFCHGATAAPKLRSFSSQLRACAAWHHRSPSACRSPPQWRFLSFGALLSSAIPRSFLRSTRAMPRRVSSARP